MVKIISIRPSERLWKKLTELKEARLANGYPKIGTVLTAIKSGHPHPDFLEAEVTKGKKYTVADNGDYSDGYYHVMSDEEWIWVRLTPHVLKEWFGVEYNE